MRRIAAGAVLAVLCGAAHALAGLVTRVSDGDTLWLQPDDAARRPLKVRLRGIDAPELCQPWGREARAALAGRVLHRRVQLDVRSRDDYGRALADVRLDGRDIGAAMVAEGHAWSTRWRRQSGRYAEQEQAARSARRGLFASPAPLEPWRFRRLHGPCG